MSEWFSRASAKVRKHPALTLGLLSVVATALHLWLLPAPGFEGDIRYFRDWSIEGAKGGVLHLYERMYCDYPPVYLYLLKLQGLIWIWLAGETDYQSSVLFISFLKFPAVLASILGAWLLLAVLRKETSSERALLSAALYLFNPAIIFVSAYWGQIESLLALLYLPLVLSLHRQRFVLAGIILTLSIGIKLQAIVLVPLTIAILLSKRRAIRDFATGAGLCALLLFSPFLLERRTDLVLNNYLKLNDWYPYLSMNAYNIWWLVADGNGTKVSGGILLANLVSAKQLGLALSIGAQVMIALFQYRNAKDLASLSAGAAPSIISFYVFPTQMHERYILPAFIFLAMLAVYHRGWLIAYVLFGLVSLFNHMAALFDMYPVQAFEHWPAEDIQPLSLFCAGLIILLTVLSLFLYFTIPGSRAKLFSIAGGLCVLLPILIQGASSNAGRTEIPLAEYLLTWTQDWGQLRQNRSVEGRRMWISRVPFDRGLGTHANSRLTFQLNRPFNHFEAYVGLDDERCRNNQARAEIWGDGRLLWRSIPLRCGETKPQKIDLRIDGIRSLELVALDGGDGIDNDHLDWAEPKVLAGVVRIESAEGLSRRRRT